MTSAVPAVGDRVCALVAGGGYAEYCAAPAVQCLPVPGALTRWWRRPRVPETFFTVWTNVFERGRLQPWRKSLLVHGGASGIGTTAIQLGAALGARVFATAGTDAKLRAVRPTSARCGRGELPHAGSSWTCCSRAQTGNRGVDVILDMVGGHHTSADNIRLLRRGRPARSYIAALGGDQGRAQSSSQVLMKRLTVTGSTLRSRPAGREGPDRPCARRAGVAAARARGRMAPVIQEVLPLAVGRRAGASAAWRRTRRWANSSCGSPMNSERQRATR
jgi:NADPH2:quinone reductase